MQGRKGASLQSTRRIYRRMRREHEEAKGRLPAAQEGVSRALAAETVRMLEEWLSGRSVPVGVLRSLWQRVCSEEDAKR